MSQSNKRYFNTFFFEDPYVEGLAPEVRLLYLTMILNPHNNLAGCYQISINKLMNYTGLEEKTVRWGIQKLQEDRKILFSGHWLALKNFIKNNQLNPNMCLKAFDIMKSSPREQIVFIISNYSQEAEPWVEDFVIKVEAGINATIDSQNRNSRKRAKEKGLPASKDKPHQVFTMKQFITEILTPERRVIGEGLGEWLGEPSAEYKYELEFEEEIEIEKEYEQKNHSSSDSQSFPDQKSTSELTEWLAEKKRIEKNEKVL